ncbi:DUF461 domain-containing protein [Streptomyces sp. TRM70308]|uniref:DUF461 domain-containing protein n=1 Tax=Streptomyces sp. TRM70308 TaxID=3131932 RepID=UPI003CFC2390
MSSSRTSLRRGAVAAALALSTLTLAGCAAGVDAATNQIVPDNASTSEGDIELQNVTVVTTEDGEGPASVTARIFNGGGEDETLQGITFATDGGTGQVELSPADGGSLTVPAGGHLMLGGEGNAAAVIEDAGERNITDGEAQPLTFELSETGDIPIRAFVYPETQLTYSEFGPSPAATSPGQTPEGTQSPAPGVEPSAEGSTESPGAGESPAAGETPAAS